MRIDHVEILVPSRRQAAQWYVKALGLTAVEAHSDWARGEHGPLMISADGGDTNIALFRGRGQGDESPRGLRRLAFKVPAEEFLRLLASSGDWRETPLGGAEIQDHQASISVYFQDPWGNHLEVTTYEPEPVRRFLSRAVDD